MSEPLTGTEKFNLGFIIAGLLHDTGREKLEKFFATYAGELILAQQAPGMTYLQAEYGRGYFMDAVDIIDREREDEPQFVNRSHKFDPKRPNDVAIPPTEFVPSRLMATHIYTPLLEGAEYVIVASELSNNPMPKKDKNDGFGDYSCIFLAIERERLRELDVNDYSPREPASAPLRQ